MYSSCAVMGGKGSAARAGVAAKSSPKEPEGFTQRAEEGGVGRRGQRKIKGVRIPLPLPSDLCALLRPLWPLCKILRRGADVVEAAESEDSDAATIHELEAASQTASQFLFW